MQKHKNNEFSMTDEEREAFLAEASDTVTFRWDKQWWLYYAARLEVWLLVIILSYIFADPLVSLVKSSFFGLLFAVLLASWPFVLAGASVFSARREPGRGKAVFEHNGFALWLGDRKIELAYNELVQLKYRATLTWPKEEDRHGARRFYRLHINAGAQKIVLQGSFTEAYMNDMGGTDPGIELVMHNLCARSGLPVKLI